ncbi:MAG: hypothetical protein FWE74_01195 [Oscillospiraceae bacterium]|nr:hypothetical protein [Oscillospiraceae bacterium]
MKNIIEELYHAFEDASPINSCEQQKANKIEDKLWNVLGKKEKRLFSDYQDARIIIEDEYAKRDFWSGFCLGCRLMTEVAKYPDSSHISRSFR